MANLASCSLSRDLGGDKIGLALVTGDVLRNFEKRTLLAVARIPFVGFSALQTGTGALLLLEDFLVVVSELFVTRSEFFAVFLTIFLAC